MWKWLNRLHDRAKAAVNLWGALAGIVAIFTLGSATTSFLFERFDPRGESEQQAAGVHRRVDDLANRLTSIVSWVKDQLSSLKGDQDGIRREVSSQYQAINQRLDQQNMLMVEVLKAVRKEDDQSARDPQSSRAWSLIDSARAATRNAAKN